MKEILATWIVIQLFLIGFIVASIHNDIVDKTYKCSDHSQKVSRFKFALLPLALFIPSDAMPELNEYCHLK